MLLVEVNKALKKKLKISVLHKKLIIFFAMNCIHSSAYGKRIWEQQSCQRVRKHGKQVVIRIGIYASNISYIVKT